jgi:hypothetical protein
VAKTKLPKMKDVAYYQAKQSASGDLDGEPWVINSKTILREDDPLVKAYPQHFVPLAPTRMRPAVEQTTAAPGEVRGD